MKDFLPQITDTMTSEQARLLNSLVLAFVGDAVQTLYVRTKVVSENDSKAGLLHNLVSKQINASSQSEQAQKLVPLFDEEELSIYKRARNSKKHTAAKNASILDYNAASGLEAVIGFLYLCGRRDRLKFLMGQ